jgi:hypothetical protein
MRSDLGELSHEPRIAARLGKPPERGEEFGIEYDAPYQVQQ